jgi:hypothetical protein
VVEVDLGLGEVRPGRVEGRLGTTLLLVKLVEVALRNGSAAEQRLGASLVKQREFELRLRRRNVCPVAIDRSLIRVADR